jgi:peptide/nickel transport system ATP-binding protein
VNIPPGCAFNPRCPFAMDVCRLEKPDLIPAGPGRSVRCWLHQPHGAGA